MQLLESTEPSVLSGSAPAVFALLEIGRSAPELVVELSRQYPEDRAVIEAGVASALTALLDASIIVTAS